MSALDLYTVPSAPCPVDLRLDGNEGMAPDPAILAGFDVDRLLRRYPGDADLRAALAARFDVEVERVAVTAGADDALDRIVRLAARQDNNVVLPEPTFVMLRRYAEQAGTEIRSLPWPDGVFPRQEVLDAIDDRTSLVFVVTPNNPTGATVTAADLRAVAAAASRGLVVVDLAYAEFADDDLMATALELPNAIVVRTFSKAWGLAGCRVGYAIGAADRIEALRAIGPPYPVASASLALAERRLEQERDVQAFVGRVRSERVELARLLRALGIPCLDSQANFVLMRSARAAFVRAALAGFGIAVRGFSRGDHESLGDALRITCPGDARAFARLTAALRTALQPEALLFDMDGVLADVRGSYRRAIVETAAAFGVALSQEAIGAAKRRGQANDDWELTRGLLADHGVELTLSEVRERFEAIYQGGLWRDEPLLVARDRLLAWRGRMPLAIVTGRPRGDAERFLDMHGIRDCFDAVVAREDAALKPAPDPVLAACAQLGVERAWMVGDTPDDVVAARAAEVLAIGCLPPGESAAAELRASLHRVGAGVVLESVEELEELLS